MSERPGPHVFVADPDLPHKDHEGRRVCLSCHLLGRESDAHHAMPDVPEQALARTRVDPHDE